jgi:hypothetical protein
MEELMQGPSGNQRITASYFYVREPEVEFVIVGTNREEFLGSSKKITKA